MLYNVFCQTSSHSSTVIILAYVYLSAILHIFPFPTCRFDWSKAARQRARCWFAETYRRRRSVHHGWSMTRVMRRHLTAWYLKHARNRLLLILESRWRLCEIEWATQVPLMWPDRVWWCPPCGSWRQICGCQASVRVDRLSASASRLNRCILIEMRAWWSRLVSATGKERVRGVSAGFWNSDRWCALGERHGSSIHDTSTGISAGTGNGGTGARVNGAGGV